jgi:hypothetical protein
LVAPSSPSEIVGYRSASGRRLDVLAFTTVTGDAELLNAQWQVAMQPLRHPRRQRRDDHLVERLALKRLAHAPSGSVSPIRPSTCPPAASSSSGMASSTVRAASSVPGSQ